MLSEVSSRANVGPGRSAVGGDSFCIGFCDATRDGLRSGIGLNGPDVGGGCVVMQLMARSNVVSVARRRLRPSVKL